MTMQGSTYNQMSLDELAATLATETRFHTRLRQIRSEGYPARTAPPVRPAAQTCPLCRGHLADNVCDRCGMEVLR